MDDSSGELSIGDLLAVLWSRRLLIVGVTLLSAAIGVTVALLLPEKFESSVVLAPSTNDSTTKFGRAGALLSQFGGLGMLGGLAGGGQRVDGLATLTSAVLTEGFIRDLDLLPVLYADDWDAATKTWKITDPDRLPTLWKAERLFREDVRSVTEDKKTGLITLTITWTDPVLAAQWATELVARTNALLRQQAIDEAQRSIEYLNGQLGKTSVVELQKAIYGLIETQIKQVMIANGNEQYAFRVIDPARVPEKRSSPKRAAICVLATLLGGLFGCVLAFTLPRRPQPASR